MSKTAWMIHDNIALIHTYINKKRILDHQDFVTDVEVCQLIRAYVKEHHCSQHEACENLKRHYRKEYLDAKVREDYAK